ncbi:acyltransferase [Clostridium algoriphilum]|uniref:acyltransferase family protein n=1 Tax=Clostridium algoriphilum TaxID=198347 RepID=UPI001CF593E6|nr:acyltransferase [Clostridium algoriphilum]MCB2293945.1 acyltransferase [Clostridium algoriphilum]
METKNFEFTKTHTQIAKGIAIILMMIHHLFAFPDRIQNVSYVSMMPLFTPSVLPGNSIEFLLGDFGKICVAMYLFLSGYGLYISSTKKENFTFKDSVHKMMKFLINYWVIFIIFVPVGLVWFSDKPAYHFNIIIFMKNLFTLSYSYNYEWWFVRLYIELLLLFPLIKRLLKKQIKSSLMLSLGLYLVSIGMEAMPKIQPGLSFLEKNFIYNDIQQILFWQMTFCLGCLASKYNLFSLITKWLSSKKLDRKSFYIIMILVIMIIRVGFSYAFEIIGKGNSSYVDFILAPIFVLFCANLVYKNESSNKICRNRICHNWSENIFLALGKHSTNIWLVQSFFIFYYFQTLVFFPKLSILIVIWLTVLCLESSMTINFIIKWTSKVLQDRNQKKKEKEVLT